MSSITRHGPRIRQMLLDDYIRGSSSFLGLNASSALFRASEGEIKLTSDIFLVLEYDDEPMPILTGKGDLREEIGEKFAGGEESGGWTKEILRDAMHYAPKRVTLGDLGVTGENKSDDVPGLYMPICKVVNGQPETLYDSELFPRNYYKWLYRLAYDVSVVDWEKVLSYGILPESDEVFRENKIEHLTLSSLYNKTDLAATLKSFGIPSTGLSRNRLFVKAAIVHYHSGDLVRADAKIVKHVKPLLSLIDNSEQEDRPFHEYVLESALFLDCKGAYDMITYVITRLGKEIGGEYASMYSGCVEELFHEQGADIRALYLGATDQSELEIFRISEKAGDDPEESLSRHKDILESVKGDRKRMKLAEILRTVIKTIEYAIQSEKAGREHGSRDYELNGVIYTAYLDNSEGKGSNDNELVIDGIKYPKDYVVDKRTSDKVARMFTYARSGTNAGLSKGLTGYVDYWIGEKWRTHEGGTRDRPASILGKRGKGWGRVD